MLYEGFSALCFNCGRLDHSQNKCYYSIKLNEKKDKGVVADKVSIWVELKLAFQLYVFMQVSALRFHAFFFFSLNSKITVQGIKNTIHTLFTYYS